MKRESKIKHFLGRDYKNQSPKQRFVAINILFTVLLMVSSFMLQAQSGNTSSKNFEIKTVVIDAGHGGHDPGCIGSDSKEKEVCLSVALKMGKLIQSYFPDVKVIYTRDKDVFVKLHERANIANKSKADLFISIHANSAQNKAAYGTETFVMGTKYTDRNLELAKRENSVILLEENYEENYDGYDPNSPMSNILMGLYQQEFLQSSINFATKVEHQFKTRNNRHSRGVKQRVLLVMYRTTMPSVLIELGFLTNLKNEQLLKSEVGQAETAGAVFRAFVEYKREMEGAPKSEIILEEAKLFAQQDSTIKAALNIKLTQHQKDVLKAKAQASKDSILKIAANLKAEEAKNAQKQRAIAEYDLLFRVQITSSSKKIPLNSRKFKDVQDVFEYKTGETYKYAVGNCVTLQEASALQQKVRVTGFSDAFVVAFYKNKRVSVKKAKELLAAGKQ